VKPHRFHPEADAEYAEAAEYYAAIQPELGGRFYDEIEDLIAGACSNPTRWSGESILIMNFRKSLALFVIFAAVLGTRSSAQVFWSNYSPSGVTDDIR
jgi:hypothetical protein